MMKKLLGLAFIVQALFIGTFYVLLGSDYSNTFLDHDGTTVNNVFISRRIASSPNNSAAKLVREQRTPEHHQPSPVTTSAISSRVERTQASSDGAKLTTFLLIMISTLPESFIARESIRETWLHGLNDNKDAIVRFAVGIKEEKEDVVARVLKEGEMYRDLVILEDVKDYYITPTNKTLSMIVWAHNNVDFKYFMKSDPVTYVFVKNMVSVLRQRSTTKGLYYGKMQYKKRPNRKGSEYKDTTWDLTDTYLPFALGGGYVLSSDLTVHIFQRRNYIALRTNEDTAIASWIVPYHFERRDDDLWCVTSLGKSKTLEGQCEDHIIAQMCYGVSEVNLREWFNKIAER